MEIAEEIQYEDTKKREAFAAWMNVMIEAKAAKHMIKKHTFEVWAKVSSDIMKVKKGLATLRSLQARLPVLLKFSRWKSAAEDSKQQLLAAKQLHRFVLEELRMYPFDEIKARIFFHRLLTNKSLKTWRAQTEYRKRVKYFERKFMQETNNAMKSNEAIETRNLNHQQQKWKAIKEVDEAPPTYLLMHLKKKNKSESNRKKV